MPLHFQRGHGLRLENRTRTIQIKNLFCWKYCRKLGNAKIKNNVNYFTRTKGQPGWGKTTICFVNDAWPNPSRVFSFDAAPKIKI